MMAQQLASKPTAFKTSSTAPSFKQLTTIKATRKTTKEKQDERELKIAWDDIRSAAYKFASNAYALNREGKLKLKKFNGGANKVATEVNDWFGCELISGRDIEKCYREKRVGQSPPRRGKPPIISKEVFRYVCDAVYSANSIDQANCDLNRMNRVEMREQVSSIVNAWLIKNNEDPLNDIAFYARIENELARKVKLKAVDHRDAIRAAWLTYENQKEHYEQWERFLIDTGFGRPATSEELLLSPEWGSVILFPGQVSYLYFVLFFLFCFKLSYHIIKQYHIIVGVFLLFFSF